MKIDMTPVPPPVEAPTIPEGERLGLAKGLRPEVAQSMFRCGACGTMQPPDAIQVWVPSGIIKSDPAWAVEERCREMAYNGSYSGWCFSCAPKATNEQAIATWPRKRWLGIF